MTVTLNDIRPIGLCITTQELFDTKKFLYNYCDMLIMKGKDDHLKNELINVKRELNALTTQRKFLDGYKAIITSNIEKILCLAASRYEKEEPNSIAVLLTKGKDLIKNILKSNNFEEICGLEGDFKSNITLPVYELFLRDMKKSNVDII